MQLQFLYRSRRVWIGALLSAALLVAVVALVEAARRRSSASSQLATHASHSDYVDGAICASCHRDIAETYSKTGMGRSFSTPTAANVVEDYTRANTLFHQPSGLHYTMVERNGELFERRSQAGFD